VSLIFEGKAKSAQLVSIFYNFSLLMTARKNKLECFFAGEFFRLILGYGQSIPQLCTISVNIIFKKIYL
jgi:hypothetical protein